MSSKECFDSIMAENELPVSLQKSINDIIKMEGYKTYKVDIKCVSTAGGNYLGILYEIDVEGTTINGGKETYLFVKAALKVNILEDIFPIKDVYSNEVYFYKDFAKVFENLENLAMIPLEKRFHKIKCYEQTNVEAIILENLAKKGFKTLHRMDVPSLKFVELCIQEIAKFHAFSYVIQKRDPKYFCEKISSRKSATKFSAQWEKSMLHFYLLMKKYCDGELEKKIGDFLPVCLKKLRQYYTDQESTICCLCHGDFRVSNTLALETEGETENVILLDYQLIYYGCPVNDFLYFIYSCTDRNFRSQHLEHIKDLYHNTLSRFLQYFNIDVEDVYPRKEFERVLHYKKDFPMILALYLYPILFVPESVAPDVGENDVSAIDYDIDPRGRERFLEIAEEFWS